MKELLEKIKALAKKTGWKIDMMDVGCIITSAMNKEQIADLKAMVEFLEGQEDSASSILANVLHDLNGLKAVYFKTPEGNCFSPRSAGYTKKIAS